MKITFSKEQLLLAVTRSLGCVSSVKTIGAVEGILIESIGSDKCKICSNDLDKGMKTIIDAEVYESGSIVINAQKLASVIKFMPSDIVMETNESSIVNITSEKTKFQLHYIPGEEFPPIPELSPERSFEINQKNLKKMINQTLFAISHDESRPNLTGLYFEVRENEILTVGCDSFRLAVRRTRTKTDIVSKTEETEIKFIVPGNTVTELYKLLGDGEDIVKFSLTRKHIIFSMKMKYGSSEKETVIYSRLIDASYIDYMRFIPKENKTFVKVDKNQLEGALERASLVTEEKTQGQTKSVVKFNFNGEKLDINASSVTGRVHDEIDIEKQGPDIEIGFSCKYLLDILRVTDVDILELSLTTPLMCMIITAPDSDDFIYLALPTKTRQQ